MAVERGLGSGSCLGNSSSLLPAAHCTSAFPSTKAKSQSWAGLCKVQDHLHGTVPMPANLPAQTDFLCSPPHPSLLALSWQGWHAACQHRGTPEMQLSELGGKQGALVLRTADGIARHPRVPQPKDRFNFQTASAQSEEKREHNRGRAEREFPVPPANLLSPRAPALKGPSSHQRAAPSSQTWPPWSAARNRQQVPLCTARQA